jgi:phospholipid transport system transporter-binding protein
MLTLPATLTQSQAQATLAGLLAAVPQEGAQVVVDASALTEFDSAALAVLLALRRQCMAAGKTLVCDRLTPRLSELAALYGITELFTPA